MTYNSSNIVPKKRKRVGKSEVSPLMSIVKVLIKRSIKYTQVFVYIYSNHVRVQSYIYIYIPSHDLNDYAFERKKVICRIPIKNTYACI